MAKNRSEKTIDKNPKPKREHRPPTIDKALPRCVTIGCESTEFENLRHMGEVEFHGVTEDGQRYTSIERRRVRCHNCGQVQVHKAHRFDPKLWRSGEPNAK